MRKHLLTLVVILTAATGCDNVAWGGIDVALRPPPEVEAPEDAGDDAEPDDPEVKVPGPVLLAGDRDGARGSFVVVGEVLDGGLNTFPDPAWPDDVNRLEELTAPGAVWVLFSEGVRVGRLTVESASPAENYCGARTRVSGVIELVPSAAQADRFLAMSASDAGGQPYGAYEALAHVYDQRVSTLSIAGEAIPRNGESWPAGGVLGLRDDIRSFRPSDAPIPWVAATFVHQDQLGVASPGPGAYSLFVIGRPGADGAYGEGYTWFRSVEAQGKGVAQYHDHLDWDEDGESEILLDVFGANRRWFAALDREGGTLTKSFEDQCGSGSTASR